MGRTRWLISRIVRKIWFRAALISLSSVGLAVLASIVSPYLPYRSKTDLGQDAVGTILQIMASSMLAVTTFSLTAMVSAYASATSLATPRATQLLIDDPTSQNALSTFLGAFVFSIVGIIGLQTSAYGSDGRTILFGATVLIVIWVVVTLLRWIAHITAFGRMADVIDRVENAAVRAMRDFTADPYLGGRPDIALPGDTVSICSERTGYVTHIDVAALGEIARRSGLRIHVAALPGTMVHPHRPLIRVERMLADEFLHAVRDAFAIERHRSFDQDPRLGIIALSEIGSRAMSDAVNDPGTAIEVLNALLRVLSLIPADDDRAASAHDRPNVYLPRPQVGEMLIDAFRPIVRDGAKDIEVMLRLDATLGALRSALPGSDEAIRSFARQAADRVRRTMNDPDDLSAFDRAVAET